MIRIVLLLIVSYLLYINLFREKPLAKNMSTSVILTKTLAEQRVKVLVQNSISYKLNITTPLGKSFHGTSTVEFKTHNKDPLFIEYGGKKFTIDSFNGKQVEKKDDSHEYLRKDNGFLWLPQDMLMEPGEVNTQTISFENDYYNDGNGIHTFNDVDGKQYIYTQGETHWCNRVFPVFDQPDLKATIQITVTAHKDWVVISNQNYIEKKDSETAVSLFITKTIGSFNMGFQGDSSCLQLLPLYSDCRIFQGDQVYQ